MRETFDVEKAVVGGGIGGLSAAAYLGASGSEVELFEKNPDPGGRAAPVELGNFRISFGPSWYIAPEVYDSFFSELGLRRDNYYGLAEIDNTMKAFFADGSTFTVPQDYKEFRKEVSRLSSSDASTLDKYFREAEQLKNIALRDRTLEASKISSIKMAAKGLRHADKLVSTDRYHRLKFESRKLRKILGFATGFLGGTPDRVPALFSPINHYVFRQKLFHPLGGFSEVARSVSEAAEKSGVKIRTGTEVKSISRISAGLKLKTGNSSFHADQVISNAGYLHTDSKLMSSGEYNSHYWRRASFSPSAVIVYLQVESEIPELEHHNVFFGENWRKQWHDVKYGRPPGDPSIYVYNPARTDPAFKKSGERIISLMTPFPCKELDEESYADYMIDIVDRRLEAGLKDAVNALKVMGPRDINSRFNSISGGITGLSHTLKQFFFRPRMRSKKMEGLYFVGQDTYPGNGVPGCLLSGKRAASLIKDYSS